MFQGLFWDKFQTLSSFSSSIVLEYGKDKPCLSGLQFSIAFMQQTEHCEQQPSKSPNVLIKRECFEEVTCNNAKEDIC